MISSTTILNWLWLSRYQRKQDITRESYGPRTCRSSLRMVASNRNVMQSANIFAAFPMSDYASVGARSELQSFVLLRNGWSGFSVYKAPTYNVGAFMVRIPVPLVRGG